MFDIDRDGVLNFEEITEMINILIFVSHESSQSMKFRNVTPERVWQDLRQRFEKNSADHFSLAQEDFMMWSVHSPLNLVQPFMDLLFEVCHIVLGLRPQCRHMEHDIGNRVKNNEIINNLHSFHTQ